MFKKGISLNMGVILLLILITGCQNSTSPSVKDNDVNLNGEDNLNEAANHLDNSCPNSIEYDEEGVKEGPVYLDESAYLGDEKEIVSWFNGYMEALFNDKVKEVHGMHIESNKERLSETETKLYGEILEIKDIEFDLEPAYPLENADEINITWVHTVERSPRQNGCIIEKQMKYFLTKESDEWKLFSVLDWYR